MSCSICKRFFFPSFFPLVIQKYNSVMKMSNFLLDMGKETMRGQKQTSPPPPGFMFSLPTNGVRLFFVNIEYEKNLIFLSLNGIASISAYIHDFMGIIKEGENPPRKKPFQVRVNQSIREFPCVLCRVKSKTVTRRTLHTAQVGIKEPG